MTEQLEDIIALSANFDIQAETLAATLLLAADDNLQDFDFERILMSPLGGAYRRAGYDVERVRKKFYKEDLPYLMLEINRKGLFDTLPIGLFLKSDEDYDNAKERTKAINKQVTNARKFFLPYENAIYHARIAVEQLEQRYTESLPEFMYELWGLSEFKDVLDDRQRFILCFLIPQAHQVVGDLYFTKLLFEAILQQKVELEMIAPLEIIIPDDSPTSQMELGENSILGTVFRDDIPTLQVSIQEVSGDNIEAFLPKGKKRKLLEQLLVSYFLPLDTPIVTEIKVRESDFTARLEEQSFLGYNLKLVAAEA